VPPAGGSLKCWNCKADFTLSERANCDGCCWKCGNEIDLDDYVTRLQAENAALQQRLTIADQRVDDLQHQQSQSLEVNPHSLRVVLTALVGAPHEIRELQACRGLPDNPIDQLLREYNAWIETPTPATPQ
jgi:hypothetical protein